MESQEDRSLNIQNVLRKQPKKEAGEMKRLRGLWIGWEMGKGSAEHTGRFYVARSCINIDHHTFDVSVR